MQRCIIFTPFGTHCIVFVADSRSIWRTRFAHLCGQKGLGKFGKFQWKLCREQRLSTSTRLDSWVFVGESLSSWGRLHPVSTSVSSLMIQFGPCWWYLFHLISQEADAPRGQCAAPRTFACSISFLRSASWILQTTSWCPSTAWNMAGRGFPMLLMFESLCGMCIYIYI